ncbi:MAG TPA: hypothetical protein VM364_00845 [Vicinamibacterales bacterium]|nr:hypothetical protein [Vicinamibacterales bacterium]
MLSLVPAEINVAQTQTAWRVQRSVDPMTDEKVTTMVLASSNKAASLRVFCNDNNQYVAFVTLPKSTRTSGPPLIEIRFDKADAELYALRHIEQAVLIRNIGGSNADGNFILGVVDAETLTSSPGAPQIAAAGKAIVALLRSSRRMVYRLSLGQPFEGSEGSFDVRGFDMVEKTAGWSCSA